MDNKDLDPADRMANAISDDNTFVTFSSCYVCKRHIRIECYDDNLKFEENCEFLGMLGKRIYSHCPYCGEKQSGFSPYDDQPVKSKPAEDDHFHEDDEFYYDQDDDDFWWPQAEGATLIDEEDEDDDFCLEMDDESVTIIFTCPSCGEKFRLNPKGCETIYCYYCGKEIK